MWSNSLKDNMKLLLAILLTCNLSSRFVCLCLHTCLCVHMYMYLWKSEIEIWCPSFPLHLSFWDSLSLNPELDNRSYWPARKLQRSFLCLPSAGIKCMLSQLASMWWGNTVEIYSLFCDKHLTNIPSYLTIHLKIFLFQKEKNKLLHFSKYKKVSTQLFIKTKFTLRPWFKTETPTTKNNPQVYHLMVSF